MKDEFFERISRTIEVAGRGMNLGRALEISTDLQPERDGLTFIRCRVAPRNMHEIRSKRGALCLQNRKQRRRFSDKHDAPPARVYAPRKMIRESYLFLPHLVADSSDLLTLCAKKDTRGILFENFDYRIRGKDTSIYLKESFKLKNSFPNFLKRYLTSR